MVKPNDRFSKRLDAEYVVKRTSNSNDAEITRSGQLVARIEKSKKDGLRFQLKVTDGSIVYELDPRIDGMISPFSLTIYEDGKEPLLKIKSGCFSYEEKIYLFKSVPEGKSMSSHLEGGKYICRLENFPFHSIDEIDRETWEKLSRHRGVDVGRLSGFGRLAHKVILDEGLAGIGLVLSAASYLLYSTG